MSVEILQSGFLTTLQDAGRTGYAAQGFPECGACDIILYREANYRAGNAEDEAAIEFTVTAPRLLFRKSTVIGIAVPDGSARLNGEAVDITRPVPVPAGAVLDIAPLSTGMRGYIAVYGGFQTEKVMGSRSADLKSGIGARLKNGDALPCEKDAPVTLAARLTALYDRLIRRRPLPARDASLPVRVLPGPQYALFGPDAVDEFFANEYTVSPDSNRMGVRLEGRPLPTEKGTDILSDGILTGSVQISSGGQPIVMLSDHQTTGGYAKLACVIPTDIPRVAQARPGETIRFAPVSEKEALREYRAAQKRALAFQKALRRL